MKNQFMQYILKLWIPFKNWTVGKILLLLSFLSPIQPLIICATLVSMLDYFVKIYCVYKVDGKKGLDSTKMKDTFYKILLYASVITVLFVVDQLFVKTLFLDLFTVTFGLLMDNPEQMFSWLSKVQLATMGTFMILTREAKSLDENWEEAFGVSPIDRIKETFGFLIYWKKK